MILNDILGHISFYEKSIFKLLLFLYKVLIRLGLKRTKNILKRGKFSNQKVTFNDILGSTSFHEQLRLHIEIIKIN